jgi:predicted permease
VNLSAIPREIAVLLLVAAVGFALRRGGWLDGAMTARLGRICVDVAMPALMFSQLVATTDAATLRGAATVPLWGVAMLAVGWAAGFGAKATLGVPATVVFLAGLPNWVYLPLPIAKATWGDEGVRTILLVNVGAMPALWTAGAMILGGGPSLKGLLTPGFVASVAAITLILADQPLPGGLAGEAVSVVGQTVALVGSLAVPLTLLLTGAEVEGLRWPGRDLLVAIALRLVVAPALAVGLLVGAASLGFGPTGPTALALALVAAMPVAVSAGPFSARFGGDGALGAEAVLWTTPLSLLTVPALLALAGRLLP